MKDILKITKLYLQKYKVIILVFWALMLALTLGNGSYFKESTKHSFANYNYYKHNNISSFVDFQVFTENYDTDKKFEYVENFNNNISYSDIESLRKEYIYSTYLDRYTNSYIYTIHNINMMYDFLDYIDSQKYLTDDERKFALKIPSLLSEMQNELSEIQTNDVPLEKNTEKWKKINDIANTINAKFPSYINNPENAHIIKFISSNMFTNKDINIGPVLFDYLYILLYYVITVLFTAVFFGLEYHSNFGKFIATLPFKKQNIYFGKVIAALIVLFGVCITIGLGNIWTIKTSIFSEVVTSWNAFGAFYKIYLILVFLVLLGAIFSSFCGSIISIIALYLPTMMFAGYPYLLIKKTYAVEIFGCRFNTDDYLGELIFGVKSTPLLAPVKFLTNYIEIHHFYIFLAILSILTLIFSLVYKKHDIDLEGYFFTNKIAKYICLTIAIVSFSVIPTIFLINLGLITILSLIIGYAIITPIFIFLFKTKLRV